MAVSLARASISAICVVEDRPPPAAALAGLLDILLASFADAEIVIVANGCSDRTALGLKALTDTLPDTAVEFLAARIDRDSATLVGIENAVGDWVLLIEPAAQLFAVLPGLFAEAARGNDVVLALPRHEWRPGLKRAPLQRGFLAFYNWLNGATALAQRPAVSLLSRPAALHVLHSPDGEMLLRSRQIAGGFPSSAVPVPAPGFAPPALSLAQSFAKAAKMLLASSTAPLRFITVCGIAGSALALVYSVYVVLVYLLKEDVQPGWTTISLQISLLTFFASAMFALLAEYIVQIHSASSVRRRFFVSREVRSQRSRRGQRLNVVDSAGTYRLGAPDEAEAAAEPAPPPSDAGR
jgi:hypothetical protein